jgi:hypothetical protein
MILKCNVAKIWEFENKILNLIFPTIKLWNHMSNYMSNHINFCKPWHAKTLANLCEVPRYLLGNKKIMISLFVTLNFEGFIPSI